MILVDTSLWIDHLRKGDQKLAAMLDADRVVSHPMVLGELACGYIKNRIEILSSIAELPWAEEATHAEVHGMIERHRLHGRGLSYIDTHLLASARLSGVPLLTRDKRLKQVATDLAIAAD
jgi:predicted nucleic acid-binding protein